ncbi:hypothetical protein K7X08_028998 [Anisodus acutangulus]|uniref:U1-type domain-containing protein n=1 Tax=Anisodus acutangulus TaxID=402998 RepID=A0A9Q1QUA5_9SOLA|nr:hypothetical protein K7X08_028998 [Anisodus acutangulus]
MVWFQCEDCGDNLKKPKLANHFRMCCAFKLSCIDCGEIFSRQTVESHTQCISEAEKYGPKGQGKASNGTLAKPSGDSKQKPDVDINVGLSDHPPWFCSLCNTSATSKQTLLSHAEGKKHRAKARAFHAKQQPKQTEPAGPGVEVSSDNNQKNEIPDNKAGEESKAQNSKEAEKDNSHSKKKRKDRESENGGAKLSAESDNNGEVIQVEKEEEAKHKKAKNETVKQDKVVVDGSDGNDSKKKINWKKLITSALKSNSDGALKLKKLKKIVLKSVNESGMVEDKSQVSDMIEHKINSSSKFIVDGKYVRLATKSS